MPIARILLALLAAAVLVAGGAACGEKEEPPVEDSNAEEAVADLVRAGEELDQALAAYRGRQRRRAATLVGAAAASLQRARADLDEALPTLGTKLERSLTTLLVAIRRAVPPRRMQDAVKGAQRDLDAARRSLSSP